MQAARPTFRLIPAARTLALALALAIAPGALAQSQLPSVIPTKQSLTNSDKSTISSFIDDWAPLLDDPDPKTAADAVRALTAPLNEQDISVSFRLEYASALAPTLDNLISGDSPRLAHVAATLAGKCGTTRSANTLKRALEDDRPAVRYAAAVGYRELLDPYFADEPLAIGGGFDRIFSAIANAIESEQEPHVVEGLITAFSGAAGANNAQAADEALTTLAAATGRLATRLRSNPPMDHANKWDRALYRSIKQAYDVSLQQQIERGSINTEFARQGAIASGLALAYVQQRLETADLDDADDTSALAPLAGLAENFIVIVNNEVNPGSPVTGGKALRATERAIDDADPARFADAVEDIMNMMRRSPYSVPADQLPQ